MNIPLLSSESKHTRNHPGRWTATVLFIQRTLYHMSNNRLSLFIETVLSPIVMLLTFTFLFGGAVAGSVFAYTQFLLPGILVLTVVPMTVYSGTTLCTDIAKGVYHRFRTMPFWQPAAVWGSIAADGLRYLATMLTVLMMGLALDFKPDGGFTGTLAAMLYILFFAYSISWVFGWIGSLTERPETVSGTSMMIVYPLLFASNVIVDTATMPGWVQTAIELNPISIAVHLTRQLFQGTADTTDLIYGIGIALLLICTFAPLTVHAYMRKSLR